MLQSTKTFFQKCYGHYAIPAVNVFFMEEIHGLFAAATRQNAPFIIQTTPFARDYAHPVMLLSMIAAASKIYPKAVFAIHLDHGNEPHILDAIHQGGYQSVMIDASHDEFDINVSRTRKIVELAHAHQITVEAELGVLQGIEDPGDEVHHTPTSTQPFTDPQEVEKFVALTQCDSLAIAVGTSHGAYKFKGAQGIQFPILEEIQRRLPGFPLVLHGGSHVNPDTITRINAAGGQLQTDSSGVREEELIKSIELGICKVNIATDLRLLWTRVTREFFRDHPDEFAPTSPGKNFMNAYQEFMCQKFDLLKTSGRAIDFH